MENNFLSKNPKTAEKPLQFIENSKVSKENLGFPKILKKLYFLECSLPEQEQDSRSTCCTLVYSFHRNFAFVVFLIRYDTV